MRSVLIELLERGARESRLVAPAWHEYFDEHDVPHRPHAHEVLGLDPSTLVYTALEVVDGDESYVLRTQFFTPGGWMTHRQDADGSEELIHYVIAGAQEIIIKTTRPAGASWMVIGASGHGPEHTDLLQLGALYRREGIRPAHVDGSFATVTRPHAGRRGPWPPE